MEPRYTRLRRRLLLLSAALVVGAAALLWLALEAVPGGLPPLFDPVSRLLSTLFGVELTQAQQLYSQFWYDHKATLWSGALLVLLLAILYLVLGWVARLFAQVGAGVRQVAEETDEPVCLPRSLAPIQADLDSLQTTLRQRQAQTRQAEQRKNDLLVFLAHDLKTPLTSVIGYLTLLRDDPDLSVEQRAKYTHIALDKAQRLEDLMGEFFDITRDSLHGVDAPADPVQLSLLLEQLTDEFLPQLQEKQLRCATDIQPRLTVMGQGDKLARVFDNVLRNAVSYSRDGGTVEIEAARRGDRVVVTIRNQGLEIPEGELALIFQKFYRLDAARSTRTGGAGLGLAIAKEIVEAHGGTIHAESNGQTTAFLIDLPSAPIYEYGSPQN
jgi:two-component system sensor histidine kinase VanS